MCAAVVGAGVRLARGPALTVALSVGLVMASHGALDAFTDGGKGLALLWPLSDERFFAPWRPIPVAPLGLGMLSWRGASVALREIVLFLPLFVLAFWPRRAPGRATEARPDRAIGSRRS
jgi:inner membrane protein